MLQCLRALEIAVLPSLASFLPFLHSPMADCDSWPSCVSLPSQLSCLLLMSPLFSQMDGR